MQRLFLDLNEWDLDRQYHGQEVAIHTIYSLSPHRLYGQLYSCYIPARGVFVDAFACDLVIKVG